MKPETCCGQKGEKLSSIEERTLIALTIKLKGKIIKTRANVDRKHLRRQLLIGRRDLRDFVVDRA
jgi:hypothetical protein